MRNSINDIIESVVNAARNEDSRDSLCSTSDTKSIGGKFLRENLFIFFFWFALI